MFIERKEVTNLQGRFVTILASLYTLLGHYRSESKIAQKQKIARLPYDDNDKDSRNGTNIWQRQ